jgi:hypothetical protein
MTALDAIVFLPILLHFKTRGFEREELSVIRLWLPEIFNSTLFSRSERKIARSSGAMDRQTDDVDDR